MENRLNKRNTVQSNGGGHGTGTLQQKLAADNFFAGQRDRIARSRSKKLSGAAKQIALKRLDAIRSKYMSPVQ